MPQFAADGCTLHYETYGGGEPVVLLHGFTSLGSNWLRHGWIDALAGFRVITLDLPAHGESDAVDDTSTDMNEMRFKPIAWAASTMFGRSRKFWRCSTHRPLTG